MDATQAGSTNSMLNRLSRSLGSLVCLLPFAGLLLLHFWLYDGLLSLLPESTKYAPLYQEDVFRRIEVPAEAEEVLGLLGEPLRRTDDSRGGQYWMYTMSDDPAGRHYRWRSFHVARGVADEKSHYFYID
jgi:hypothetical protein